MGKTGFVTEEGLKLLEETSETEDLLDFSSDIERFEKKLNTIHSSATIGLIGPYGSGKSTMLHQLSLKHKDSHKWIKFDAWKYPDRKNLWEGFVLDFARQIDPKTFDEIRKKIDGEQNNDKKTLISTIASIPLLNVVKNLEHFWSTSPARRVFEIQDILTELLDNIKSTKKIIVVIEDIDRSGDAGVFFLETLKQFIDTYERENQLLAIVPISDDSFQKNNISYQKCLAYIEFFVPGKPDFDKFVQKIFKSNEELIEFGSDIIDFKINYSKRFTVVLQGTQKLEFKIYNILTQISSFLTSLWLYNTNTTMRTIKQILRKANIVYLNQIHDGYKPDLRLTICIESSKFFENSLSTQINEEMLLDINNIWNRFIFNTFFDPILLKEKGIAMVLQKTYYMFKTDSDIDLKNMEISYQQGLSTYTEIKKDKVIILPTFYLNY